MAHGGLQGLATGQAKILQLDVQLIRPKDLVEGVPKPVKEGASDLFSGFIIILIVGNVAERWAF